jgi:hypothetical protein
MWDVNAISYEETSGSHYIVLGISPREPQSALPEITLTQGPQNGNASLLMTSRDLVEISQPRHPQIVDLISRRRQAGSVVYVLEGNRQVFGCKCGNLVKLT